MSWQHGDLQKGSNGNDGHERDEVVEDQSVGYPQLGTALPALDRGSSSDIRNTVSQSPSKGALAGESPCTSDSHPSTESAPSPKPLLSKVGAHLSGAKEFVKTISDKVGMIWFFIYFALGIVSFPFLASFSTPDNSDRHQFTSQVLVSPKSPQQHLGSPKQLIRSTSIEPTVNKGLTGALVTLSSQGYESSRFASLGNAAGGDVTAEKAAPRKPRSSAVRFAVASEVLHGLHMKADRVKLRSDTALIEEEASAEDATASVDSGGRVRGDGRGDSPGLG